MVGTATVWLSPMINMTGSMRVIANIRKESLDQLIHLALRSRNGARQKFLSTSGMAQRRVTSHHANSSMGHLPNLLAKCQLQHILTLATTPARGTLRPPETQGLHHHMIMHSTLATTSLLRVRMLVTKDPAS